MQKAEQLAQRKAKRAAEAAAKAQDQMIDVAEASTTVEPEVNDDAATSEEPFESHEWLVE